MTYSQAADYDSCLVRYSPRTPGFSQSNQHNYIQGLKNNIGKGGIKNLVKGVEGGLFEKGGGDKYHPRTMVILLM